jgi:hypothetical protein
MSKELNYEYVKNYIENRGCLLLSDSYINRKSKLNIMFSCGHDGLRSFEKFVKCLPVCKKCSGNEKNCYDDIKKYFGDCGYDLKSEKYESNKQKLTFSDFEDYFYYCGYNKFKHTLMENNFKPRKFDINNPYTIKNLINFLKRNNSILKLLNDNQKYFNSSYKMDFIDGDGFLYTLSLSGVLALNKDKMSPSKFHLSNDYTLKNIDHWLELNNKSFRLVDGQIYEGITKKLYFKCFKCPEDEIPFLINISGILNGNGCGICSNRQVGKFNSLVFTHPNVAQEWDFANNYITPDQVVYGSPNKYFWVCPNCNRSYKARISDRAIKKSSCPFCDQSKGEKKISEYFTRKNISFSPEFLFENCRDVRRLPFDFYLTKYNVCIEYSGQQHFYSIDYFGGEKCFEITQRHDKIKKEYCENNNIPLIVIPYWDFKNIEQILTKELNLEEGR